MQSLYPELWRERQAKLFQEAEYERSVNGMTGQQWHFYRAWAYRLGSVMKRWGNNLMEFGVRRGGYSTAKLACSRKSEQRTQYAR